VTALEKTLEQMVGSNVGFSKSFKAVNEKRAFDERAALREKLDRAYDRLKFKRNEERAVARDIEQASSRLGLMADEKGKLAQALAELERRRTEAQTAVQVRAGRWAAAGTARGEPQQRVSAAPRAAPDSSPHPSAGPRGQAAARNGAS